MFSVNHPSWTRAIATRLAYLWPLKAVGTTAFMVLFFWGYFGVLRHPLFPASVMPLTPLDRWIPFTPLALPVYASLWVYASLPPALLRNFRQLALFGLWIGAMCLFCLGLFWIFPTVVPLPDIDWAQFPEMSIIKSVDPGGNACPSLHVAASVFTCFLARPHFCRHCCAGLDALAECVAGTGHPVVDGRNPPARGIRCVGRCRRRRRFRPAGFALHHGQPAGRGDLASRLLAVYREFSGKLKSVAGEFAQAGQELGRILKSDNAHCFDFLARGVEKQDARWAEQAETGE